MRRRSLPAALLTAIALATCAAACGEDDVERPAGRAPTATPAGGVDVRVAMREAPGPRAHAGRCADDACVRRWNRWVARASKATRACTEIYGGPETARVTGTVAGRPVDVTVARTNGCGIADYEALFALLGRRPPVAGAGP